MSNMTKRMLLCSVGVALVFLAVAGFVPSEPSLSQLVSTTVLVTDGHGHGSGVILGPRSVLTARHVAMDFTGDGGRRSNLVVVDSLGGKHRVLGSITDPNSDAAILFVSPAMPKVKVTLSAKPGNLGDLIVTVGAPCNVAFFPSVSVGRIMRIDSDARFTGIEWPHVVVSDIHIAPGSSGGPVFLRGKLYGIAVGHSGVISIILPVSEFKGLLNR
jgi:S1-C subfamily serine protease